VAPVFSPQERVLLAAATAEIEVDETCLVYEYDNPDENHAFTIDKETSSTTREYYTKHGQEWTRKWNMEHKTQI
jgi:hypothetical protein